MITDSLAPVGGRFGQVAWVVPDIRAAEAFSAFGSLRAFSLNGDSP